MRKGHGLAGAALKGPPPLADTGTVPNDLRSGLKVLLVVIVLVFVGLTVIDTVQSQQQQTSQGLSSLQTATSP